MASKSIFVCKSCGAESLRWQGKCEGCGEWNTLEEVTSSRNKKAEIRNHKLNKINPPINLASIKSFSSSRIKTNIEEVDRVLGGGLVPGQVVLLAGEPGVGKSTLLLQLASNLIAQTRNTSSKNFAEWSSSSYPSVSASQHGAILYVSGEESAEQIKLRADRLGVVSSNISLLNETDVDSICLQLNALSLHLVIVDSIQTLTTSDFPTSQGSVVQVRECAQRLINVAKSLGIPLILVGHITKEGNIAGPKVLEHLVDTVLYLSGDKNHVFRLLRVTKNRFGAVNEVGVFSMEGKGLEEVKNPSEMFLKERLVGVSGSVATSILEGTRPVVVEIQALTSKTIFGFPKRTASGFSLNRLNLLCAVLEKRVGVNLHDKDVYLNVAGGIKSEDPAVDLAVCLSVVSSVSNKTINSNVLALGEVGLLGEIRNVARIKERVSLAKKLGFTKIVSSDEFKSIKVVISNLELMK